MWKILGVEKLDSVACIWLLHLSIQVP